MSLLVNMLSRLVTTFLPRSKHLLISWLQSPPAVILEPRKIKSATVFTVSPSFCHEVMGLDAMILVFWILSFKSIFSLSSFTFIKCIYMCMYIYKSEEPGRLQSMGSLGVDTTERSHFHFSLFTRWGRKWQPTPLFLPGESQGWGSLVGCCLWGSTESDTAEAT